MKKLFVVLLALVLTMMSIVPVCALSSPDLSDIINGIFGGVTLEKTIKVSEFANKYGYASAVITDSNGNVLDADAYVPNGATCLETQGDWVVTVAVIIVMEDVNCDGRVTAADARLALRCSARLENLDGVRFVAADVNKDNKVTAADARLILRKPAGLA